MLSHAFKEWAVVCEALARGEQSMILRKGGIDERFALEQTRFWFYPTFTHQQEGGVKESARPLLNDAQANRPLPGLVRLTHWAEVTGVYRLHDLPLALLLDHLHIWSDATVEQRFRYRTPGLNVFAVRVYRCPKPHDVAESASYAGCKSWVELEHPLEIAESSPVLGDGAFRRFEESLHMLLQPTGLA